MTSIPRAEEATAKPALPVAAPQATAQQKAGAAASSYLALLVFYLPLGFSGLMMTLDSPIVVGVLNRFPNADTSVAAFSVAFALALVYEASHISMIDISTALSTDLQTFNMLRRFYVGMSAVLLLFASIVAFSPIYDSIVHGVMNYTQNITDASRPAVWAFLLWPIPIGWRRLCQGALIKHGHPKPVGAGGIVRLASLIASLAFFSWLGTNVVHLEPAAIGVLSMLVSVTAESAAVQGWTLRVMATMPKTTPGKPPPTYGDLWRFFFPLGSTAIMSTLVQPVLRTGIATAALTWATAAGSGDVTVATASYQTGWTVAFLAFGPTLSMTQASIAWNSNSNPLVRLRGPRVILTVGLVLGALMLLVGFTPLAEWVFANIIQSPPETARRAAEVVRWLAPMPILQATSFTLRGRLIALRRPKAVRLAQFVDLLFLIILLQLSIGPGSLLAGMLKGAHPAAMAALAYNLMLCVDIAVLLFSLRGDRASIDRHKVALC